MPQGRRKVPFSSKQKKIQLQEKRVRKKNADSPTQPLGADELDESSCKIVSEKKPALINADTVIDKTRDSQRYKLIFKKEDQEELRKRREEAHLPLKILPEDELEVSFDEFYVQDELLDIPKRPPWDFNMDKRSLEVQEERYFRNYVHSIRSKYAEEELSFFELNLETWRQLWRVLEMSDIVLLVADIRHPILHFPPGLYKHITEELQKEVVLILNKADLVAPSLVLSWKLYFQEHFPLLHLHCFSSFGGMPTSTSRRGRRKGKLRMAAEGARNLYSTCQKIVTGRVDLSSWRDKIEEELASALSDNVDEDEELNPLASAPVHLVESDSGHYKEEKYAHGILTLGFVGHPNVGKSSLLNAVMGKKVVSVSRTPGHTKHFQTIFLTPEVRLCDCPGLVFPSRVPKAMQVLSGCFPIAQLREPYSAVGYLGQRLDLPKFLRLSHPQYESGKQVPPWSAYDLCEAWAILRGFRTARAARPDVHRAANHLLRMALDGRSLCLKFYPPGYTMKKAFFESHPEVQEIKRLQGVAKEDDERETFSETSSEDDEEEGKRSVEDQRHPVAETNKFALLTEDD